jgi:hypothetical protein
MAIQDFTAGQVLTAAQMDNLQANDYNQTVSTKTADYTLVAADKGTRVVMNAAGATTITVNTSLFSAGDTLQLQNIGAGVTTVTAGTATVSSAGPLAIPQFGSGTLFFSSAGVAIYFPSAVTIPPASSGLTLISATTTTGASVTVANCFSATYRNYLIVGDSITGNTNGYAIEGRFGVSGTPTSADYIYSNATGAAGAAANSFDIATGGGSGNILGFTLNVFAPNAAAKTIFTSYTFNMQGGGTSGRLTNGVQTSSNQFTDFILSPQSGSTDFSAGTVRVYGYANS